MSLGLLKLNSKKQILGHSCINNFYLLKLIDFSLQPQQQATILPYNPACTQARRDSIDVEAIMHRTNLTLHPPPEVMASVRPLPPPPEVMAAVRPMQPPPPVSLPQVPESPRRGWVPTQATHHNPTPSNAALLLGNISNG